MLRCSGMFQFSRSEEEFFLYLIIHYMKNSLLDCSSFCFLSLVESHLPCSIRFLEVTKN